MTPFDDPQFVATNGIRLAVYAQGTGKPVVLCHGVPELAFSWRHQMQPLADAGYHVIAPDQRGYGHSTVPTAIDAYGTDNLTADLFGLLDHYGKDDAVFVGHDWGSMVVWEAARHRPDGDECDGPLSDASGVGL